jgi:hypothetical protein
MPLTNVSKSILTIAGLLVAALATGGCTTSQPVDLWQKRVAQYVAEEGHGDITSLRGTEPGEPRPVFGVTDGKVEVQGILLGRSTLNHEQWWTYIVGVMKNDDVTDLRVIGVTDVDGDVTFSQSSENEAALERYRNYRLKQWTAYRLDSESDSDFVCSFPGPNDSFTLHSDGSIATVTERQSGTRWTLVLAPTETDDQPSTAISAAAIH